ncbi:MAG: redoxin domain-containing protein [Phycisphaerales bacterium]
MPRSLCTILFSLAGSAAAWGQATDLRYSPTGALDRLGFYSAQTCLLSPDQPTNVTKTPPDAKDVLYGTIRLGPRENQGRYTVLLADASTSSARLFVDSNADGDLTNDPPLTWKQDRYSGPGDALTLHRQRGSASVSIKYDSGPRNAGINFYRMDPADPSRPDAKRQLFYYRDFSVSGTVTLGKYSYQAFFSDDRTTGDFRGSQSPASIWTTLFIDVDGNKRFDRRREAFDPRKPIVIGDEHWQVRDITAEGDRISFVMTRTKIDVTPDEKPSIKPAPETKPAPTPPGKPQPEPEKTPAPNGPPDLSVGKVAPEFSESDLDGKTVKFPGDFAGKVVVLDFWATWCRPCRDEIPHVVEAYNTFHEQGLEIVSVSLDQANRADNLRAFVKDNKMPWQQIYDGGYWNAKLAKVYDVHSIPAMFLIDGDSGKIIAKGNTLRSGRLASEVDKALKQKKAK